MSKLHFTKMHGTGNDYVYVNLFTEQIDDASKLAVFVSDRHFGIGSDGLILIAPSKTADCRMIMYNADGSEGAMCGNGKLAKVDMASYATKTNRKKLINAYSNKSPLAQAIYIKEDTELVICSSSGRMLLVNTGAILPKTTKDTQGISVMKLKKTHKVVSLHIYQEGEFEKAWRFRAKNLPAAGALPSENDVAEQITF